MTSCDAVLRTAAAADAVTIAALAIQVFLDTYANEGVRPDLAREAFSEYSADAFAARLADPQRRLLVAEHGAGLLGFTEMTTAAMAAPDGCIVGAEVIRLYVQPQAQGRGIGKGLLRAAERAASRAGLGALWLTVWEGNARAQAFYNRLGYRQVGATACVIQGIAYGNLIVARHLEDRPGMD